MNDGELHIFLGKLDGKMDMVLANQQTAAGRLSALEEKQASQENRLTIIEAHKASSKAWVAQIASAISLLIAIGVGIKDLFWH